MLMKKISLCFLVLSFVFCSIFFFKKDNNFRVANVISPTEIQLENGKSFVLKDVECFDINFSEKNKIFAKKFEITEKEAFIIGNLGKYWTRNLLEGRNIEIKVNDLIYYKFNYNLKFLNSPYCIKDGEINNKTAFNKLLKSIRRANYVVVIDEKFYPISSDLPSKDFVLLKKSHFNKIFKDNKKEFVPSKTYVSTLSLDTIKIIVTDLTTKIKPDRNCSTDICKEILSEINNAKTSIDMAIYGYSSTPVIEEALSNALRRGVKIRMVYDVDSKGENIYPDTDKITKLITNNKNDSLSSNVNKIMHNKFYIFDNKTLITGSANLSHTDMSGFNSNIIIKIKSSEVAQIYKNEFEQMYSGNFHTTKTSNENKNWKNIDIYFSPQDKPIFNGILPLIKNAKTYIYIPIFVITEKNTVTELIKAKNRGVEIKIIADALNAAKVYSKISELRAAGIDVKTENYAGKMHSKTMIVDDKYVVIGSMNFSSSGENKNDENSIVLNDATSAKFLKKFFLYQWNNIPDRWLKDYARAESWDSIGSCSDGIDNDYDGLIDLEDCKIKK